MTNAGFLLKFLKAGHFLGLLNEIGKAVVNNSLSRLNLSHSTQPLPK